MPVRDAPLGLDDAPLSRSVRWVGAGYGRPPVPSDSSIGGDGGAPMRTGRHRFRLSGGEDS